MNRSLVRQGRLAATAAMLGLLGAGGAAAAAPAPRHHPGPGHAGVHRLHGTVTFAEGPQSAPNYIFPFEGLAYETQANTAQFQDLMYRPLYWFGNGAAPTLNLRYSLAKAPAYAQDHRTVTIDLNHYRWSDGETVNAQDIVFFLNLYRSDPGAFADYAPGAIPDDIASAVATSPSTLVLHLSSPVNAYWFTYNELSQITPLPMAWDVTSLRAKAGTQLCGRASFGSIVVRQHRVKGATTWIPVSPAAKSCASVYDFLSTQSGYNPTGGRAMSTNFADNPLWAVVDGPWRLARFSTTGDDVFVPNPSYSGPSKPTYARFVEQPFTSTTAEANSLFAGATDVGYLPSQDIVAPAKSPNQPGASAARLSGYTISPQPNWGIAYALYNFTSTGDGGEAGKIIRQLYFRQAMQELVDQPLFVQRLMKGYGVPTYGPVPILPRSPFATAYERRNPYPYNPRRAMALLRAHGWKIVPDGADVCATAARCGVPQGTRLSLTMSYATGNPAFVQMVTAEDEAWSAAGISVKLLPGSFDVVAGQAVPSNHGWDLADYGLWVFQPDYYPTGEALFETGAGANGGSYSNATANALIKATDFSPDNAFFARYENYLAAQLPCLWQPTQVLVDEVSKALAGVAPLSAVGTILPETWHLRP